MFDDLDLKILDLLANNGRFPIQGIANSLDIPFSTARKRLIRLEESGAVNFSCEIDPDKLDAIQLLFVGIIVTKDFDHNIELFYEIPNVLFAASATGQYDYLALFAATSRKMIHEVIDNQLHAIDGVERTDTMLVLNDIGISMKSDKFANIMRQSTSDKSSR